jgi:transcriptional regulator with XRE-family HTH domain
MTTKTRPSAGAVDALAFLETRNGPLTFGGFMSAIRLGEDWTLAQMAASLGVSAQHLCDIEKGRRSVTAPRAARWALELGYDPSQMVQLALQAELEREGVAMTVEVRPRAARRRARTAAYRVRERPPRR